MDHKSLSIYKKFCDLDRDLTSTAFILLKEKVLLLDRLLRIIETHLSQLKAPMYFFFFQCKTVSFPYMYSKTNVSREYLSIIRTKIQFVDQVTRKTFPSSIKVPCKTDKFD